MGWLWSTPPSAPAQEKKHLPSESNLESAAVPQKSTSTTQSTRDDIADRELHSFLQEIEADSLPSSTKYNRVRRQLPSSDPSEPQDEPLSEQLLPKTMSCRDAFDSAFYCNSMGGQFNNLYRYGTVRTCSDSWNDFWFCMRTRSYGAREREEAIRARYRQKEKVKYGRRRRGDETDEEVGRSSEDIWKSREGKVEWGKAFSSPFPPPFEGTDEEWNKMERARRSRDADATI